VNALSWVRIVCLVIKPHVVQPWAIFLYLCIASSWVSATSSRHCCMELMLRFIIHGNNKSGPLEFESAFSVFLFFSLNSKWWSQTLQSSLSSPRPVSFVCVTINGILLLPRWRATNLVSPSTARFRRLRSLRSRQITISTLEDFQVRYDSMLDQVLG